MSLSPVAALVAIALVGVISQVVAWRVRLPAIVFLLGGGILLGPVAGWLQPDALFGDLLFPIVSLSVSIILFEGSLTLRWDDIRGHGLVVTRMVSIGSLISGIVAGLAAYLFAQFGWQLAVLFGALMTVTGPTVVAPMLRSIRPSRSVAEILRWEGILIDPLGALFTVLAFQFILATSASGLVHAGVVFAEFVVVGVGLGLAAGYLLGIALRRHWLPEYLVNVVTLNLVIVVFASANALAEEAGLLAVTVMGILMANMRDVSVAHIINFKETLSILLVSALFVILAARIDPGAFTQLGWSAVAVFLAMQFVGRPLKVAASTAGSTLSWRERAMIAWIGPRGIVAAAIAALFALRLEGAGVAGADLLVPLVFSIIIATVVVQGATSRWLAIRLGVAEPEPQGYLVVGANPVARAIACELKSLGFDLLLADSNRDNIRQARMAGLRTFYGNPVSAYADRRLDLVGIGRMLGLSPDPDLNALAALRYQTEFGPGEIYSIRSSVDVEGEERRALSADFRGRLLFGEEVSYASLASMLAKGAGVKTTTLSEEFEFQEFLRRHRKRAVPLFAVTPKGRLRAFGIGEDLEPGPGWRVVAMAGPPTEEEESVPPPAEERSAATDSDAGGGR